MNDKIHMSKYDSSFIRILSFIMQHASSIVIMFAIAYVVNDEQYDTITYAIASCYSFEAADGTSRHDGRLANVYTPKGS